MKLIRCAINKTHVMMYEDFGIGSEKNGYYCTKCGYSELDKDLTDDLLEFQNSRVVN